MPLFADTGEQYNPGTAAALQWQIQNNPWRQQALQHRAAIQARGGQWSPEDYDFFGISPERATPEWKDKYLSDQGINELAAGSYNSGKYSIDPQGNVTQRTSFVDSPWGKAIVLGPMIAGGGLAAASALGGGAGAAAAPEAVGGGGSSAGGLGSAGFMGGEVGPSLTAQAADLAVPGTVAGPGVAGIQSAGAPGGWQSLLGKGQLLNMGLNLGGALLGSHAAGKAADQQAAAAQQALNLEQNLYNRGSSALMPYYQAGAGSLGRLQSFLGTRPAAPLAPLPSGTLGSLGK